VPGLRMRGAIPPLPPTSSWRGAEWSTGMSQLLLCVMCQICAAREVPCFFILLHIENYCPLPKMCPYSGRKPPWGRYHAWNPRHNKIVCCWKSSENDLISLEWLIWTRKWHVGATPSYKCRWVNKETELPC